MAIRAKLPRRVLPFIGDLILSSIATIAVTAVLHGAAQLVPWVIFLTPFAFVVQLLIYVGPALVMIYGLCRERPGFVIGPFLLSAIYYLSNVGIKQQHEDRIVSFATATLEAPQHQHSVLAVIDDSARCDGWCQRALASDRAWAISWAGTSEWYVFRAGAGSDCLRPENIEKSLEFLRSGYVNLCAIRTTATELDDALVFQRRAIRPETPDPDLPGTMTGTVFEIRERIGGRVRLLGRRVEGVVKSALPDAYGAYTNRTRHVDAGPKINLEMFTADALGLTVTELRSRGPAPLGQLLDATEALFDAPGLLKRTASMWGVTASSQGKKDLDVIRPRIERLLDSNEIERTGAAMSGLFAFPTAERSFTRDRMIELAFGPFVRVKEGPVRHPLFQHLKSMPGPFPQSARERAKARLADNAELTDGEREVMLAILISGGADEKREAIELVFSPKQLPLERTVAAMAEVREPNDRWSPQDIDRLIERVPEVPTSRLQGYLAAFQATTWKEQRMRLIEDLRLRLTKEKDGAAIPILNNWIRVLSR